MLAPTNSIRLRRQRNLVLTSLLLLAAICWLLVFRQAGMASGMGLTMGATLPLFLVAWVAMMVALMFPTAAPMIVMFTTVSVGKRQRAEPFVPTWVFVSGYLVVWIAFGAGAYGAAVAATQLAMRWPWAMTNAPRFGGALLLLGGLYQLTPLKNLCLTKCRSPLSFLLTSWREGSTGAFQMGLRHGVYCLGCCWLLFAILFPLGFMNVAVMIGLTALIFAEKSVPGGPAIARAAGVAFMAYGAGVMLLSLPL